MLTKKITTLLFFCSFLFNTGMVWSAQKEDNKQIATKFLKAVVNDKSFESAAKYLGNQYTEHDPEGQDGIAGLELYIQFLRDHFPDAHIELKRVIAEGDYVIFHVHSVLIPGSSGQAIVDIFRLEDGKVVEHWDVTQDIPQQSENSNGMF